MYTDYQSIEPSIYTLWDMLCRNIMVLSHADWNKRLPILSCRDKEIKSKVVVAVAVAVAVGVVVLLLLLLLLVVVVVVVVLVLVLVLVVVRVILVVVVVVVLLVSAIADIVVVLSYSIRIAMFEFRCSILISYVLVSLYWNTVDGRNPKQPPGMCKTPVNNGINYQPQLVSRISSINSTFLLCLFRSKLFSLPNKNHAAWWDAKVPCRSSPGRAVTWKCFPRRKSYLWAPKKSATHESCGGFFGNHVVHYERASYFSPWSRFHGRVIVGNFCHTRQSQNQ